MIPDYQTAMLPALKSLRTGVRHFREIRQELTDLFDLTEEEKNQLVPSGQKLLFSDRISWSLTYMKKAGLLHTPKRGQYEITQRGKDLLAQNPQKIDLDVLSRYPDFVEWKARSEGGRAPKPPVNGTTRTPVWGGTPQESLESAYLTLRRTIEAELLEAVKGMPPAFFERLVVELLVRMGYGGSLKDAGQAVGKTGDGGIDGIIKEDILGLDVIHVQAKRWQNTVGRPDVQSFAGSLDGVRAKKGIFITTSAFSPDAKAYVAKIDKRIILIDGDALAGLMFDHNVGIAPVAAYEVKRVDPDYFSDE